MNTVSLQSNDEHASAQVSQPVTTRRCLVTGEAKERTVLIRFVLDPAGQVTPDLAERLPGRGLWVSADRELIEQAASKNLFSRSAKTKAIVPDHFTDQVPNLLKKRCLEMLGLARSAGATVTGMPQIEHGLRSNKIAVVLLASDAGQDCRKKLSRTSLIETGLTRVELGAALGQEHLAAVGMRGMAITEKLLTELVRWHGVRPPQTV